MADQQTPVEATIPIPKESAGWVIFCVQKTAKQLDVRFFVEHNDNPRNSHQNVLLMGTSDAVYKCKMGITTALFNYDPSRASRNHDN